MTSIPEQEKCEQLRGQFLQWQCLVRQYCVRQHGGRPQPGMQPELVVEGVDKALTVNVVLVRRASREVTAQFRHMVRKTMDPNERYDNAVRMLSSAYYQHPAEFCDSPTALFALGSAWADLLAAAPRCELRFAQARQTFRLICAPEELPQSHDCFQATYWHNHLFNSELPGAVRVIAFRPDWASSEAGSGG